MTANNYLPGVIFIPSSLDIVSITNAFPMVVTITVNAVTESNTYIPGQLVRLFIPYIYGMWQADGLTAQIVAVNGNGLIGKVTDFDLIFLSACQLLVGAGASHNG